MDLTDTVAEIKQQLYKLINIPGEKINSWRVATLWQSPVIIVQCSEQFNVKFGAAIEKYW